MAGIPLSPFPGALGRLRRKERQGAQRAALLPRQPPASSRPRGGRAGISALALPGLERPEIPRGSFERAHLFFINYLQLELA